MKYGFLKEYIDKPLMFTKLCDLTDEVEYTKDGKRKSGKFRTNKINEWKQFMNIEIDSNKKLVIKNIYSEEEYIALESKGKFGTYIRYYLLKDLLQKDSEIYTYNEMFKTVYFVNSKFAEARNYPYKYVNEMKINYNKKYNNDNEKNDENNAMLDFIRISYDIFKKLIDYNVDAMLEEGLISLYKNYRLYKKETYTDCEGNQKERTISKDCNNDEKKEIDLKIEELLKEYKCKKINDIHYKRYEVRKDFQEKKEKFIKERFDYSYYGNILDIQIENNGKDYELIRTDKDKLKTNIKDRLLKDKELNKRISKIRIEELASLFV